MPISEKQLKETAGPTTQISGLSEVILITSLKTIKHESNEMTDPSKTSRTPTKTPTMLQSLGMFFLIHTPEGWIQVHIFTDPILAMFL
jgi:hypothetical protein